MLASPIEYLTGAVQVDASLTPDNVFVRIEPLLDACESDEDALEVALAMLAQVVVLWRTA